MRPLKTKLLEKRFSDKESRELYYFWINNDKIVMHLTMSYATINSTDEEYINSFPGNYLCISDGIIFDALYWVHLVIAKRLSIKIMPSGFWSRKFYNESLEK